VLWPKDTGQREHFEQNLFPSVSRNSSATEGDNSHLGACEGNTRGDLPVRERNRHAVVGDLVQKHALLAVGLLASLCGALGGASHLRERVGQERSAENSETLIHGGSPTIRAHALDSPATVNRKMKPNQRPVGANGIDAEEHFTHFPPRHSILQQAACGIWLPTEYSE